MNQLSIALRELQARIAHLNRDLTVQDLYWFWRSCLLRGEAGGRRDRPTQAGFVLPTTILLLLMLSLVLSILVFRTGNRNLEVIGNRQQRQIYNAATPALNRANAKIEFLFTKETLPPLPSDNDLVRALQTSSYDLEDETRLDLDGNPSTIDPAWQFSFNVDGDSSTGVDGKEVTVAYSILSKANARVGTTAVSFQSADAVKAAQQVVRNGPINLTGGATNPNCSNLSLAPRAGWQPINSATLRKPLQVNAYAKNNETGVTATLEMQQDRQANMGNKWGAWFRYDLEVFPGPAFRWNGAMHTESNFMPTHEGGSLNLYLVSSPSSCIYTRDASEITVAGDTRNTSQFLGQVITGSMKRNGTSDRASVVHLFSDSLNGADPQTVTLTRGIDSVDGTSIKPEAIAVDPILLFTEDQNRSRTSTDPNNIDARDKTTTSGTTKNWRDSKLVTEKRIYNDPQPKPFVDDTYRADNRWGPKPEYLPTLVINEADKNNNSVLDSDEDRNGNGVRDAAFSGDLIATAHANWTQLTKTIAAAGQELDYGYDGYWERRARAQGVRVIVGQRLELGNTHGWEGGADPLNPPPIDAATGSSLADRPHEQRQWRTLRDNLAAVQTTAVYHYLKNGGEYPVACLATTGHPGNDTSRNNSRTFTLLPGVSTRLNTDFLQGNGTNGVEFAAPFASATDPQAAFGTAIDDEDSPLRVALTNLARFSGDPAGAFPARQDVAGADANNAAKLYGEFATADATGVVHPYPQLTQWGNFSELRRVLTYLEDDSMDTDGSITEYSDLSPADQSTLHTATCNLGALAYNLENHEAMYDAAINSPGPALQAIGIQLFQLMDGRANSGNGEIATNSNKYCTSFSGTNGCPSQNPYSVDDLSNPIDYRNYYAQFTPEDWIRALRSSGPDSQPHADKLEKIYQVFQLRSQIQRDRALGFMRDSGIPSDGVGYNWQTRTYDLDDGPGLGNAIAGINEADVIYQGIHCDPAQFGLSEKAEVGLIMALCPKNLQPKYPSLYYLFPLAAHAPDGQAVSTSATAPEVLQAPSNDPYVSATAHPYIFDRNGRRGINCRPATSGDVCQNNTFRPLGDANNNGLEDAAEGAGFISLLDQLRAEAPSTDMAPRLTAADWQTPVTTSATGRISSSKITVNGIDLYPAFLDKAFFNGRELMAVRALDIDFDLLRRSTITGTNRVADPANPATATDHWLPLPQLHPTDPTRTGAIFYAFREDALREDGIARPRAATHDYATWLSNWLTIVTNAAAVPSYRMNAVGTPQDPPVNPRTGISPKPVDFYPDPDRRPHGFRLRKGKDLRRIDGSDEILGTVAEPELRGVSFISDNPVYLQADDDSFNWHTQEEFTEILNKETWENFYQRTTLNPNFANRDDVWRPAEIIADAITILSEDFNEGTVTRGIQDNGAASFNGLRRNNDTDLPWIRENGIVSNNVNHASPIKFSSRGFPLYCLKPDYTAVSNNQPCNGSNLSVEYGREVSAGVATSNRTFQAIDGAGTSGSVSDDTFVNGVIVSGIVPSRGGQSYGGLHNFPRFMESWKDLYISGSLIQLNFSTSATGPFDQDSWEPGAAPDEDAENIRYYGAPKRFWGYDVALQYAPAGPVSERFISVSNTRSEFYRELPVEDPYIFMLRCATPAGGSAQVDPDANGC